MSRRSLSTALVFLLAALLGSGAGAANPDEADRLVKSARAWAAQDRNAEAANAFEQAAAVDPSRRRGLLVEWANQLAWAGRSGAAIPLYREFLADNPQRDQALHARRQLALALAWNGDLEESRVEFEKVLDEDPDDVAAKLGLAQTLSWQDLQGPALGAYEEVLRQDAGNPEAMRGMGRVESWRGKQRDARRHLVKHLLAHPGDADASFLLAQAQHWMGRPDLALDTLEGHLAAHPDDQRAQALRERILIGLRPATSTGQEESHQSDHLRISTTSVAQDFHFNDGLTTVGPRYQFVRYDPDSSDPIDRIHVQRPGLYARHRFNDAIELTGDFFLDIIDTKGGDDDVIPTFNAWVTYWLDDVFRFDVGSSRTTFDNTRSLGMGITAVYASASMDVVPDEKTRFSARFNWGDYSDGNERSWWQLEAMRRVLFRPATLVIGYRYTGMDFTETTNNGYFDPDWYHANEAIFASELEAHPRLNLAVEGSAGVETVKGDAYNFVWSAGARVGYEVSESLIFDIRYRYFSSEQASSGGFARGTGSAGMRFVW